MEKIVANGDRDCTVILDGTECSVKFDRCFLAYSVQNNSTSDVFVSIHQGANAGDDGVVRIKAGSSGVYAHMRTEVKTVYFNGTGEIQVHGQNDTNNSFRNAPVSGGGGTTVDSYSKTESDARYAQKAEIPTELPANGGNADTSKYIGTWGSPEQYYGSQLKARILFNKFGDSRFGLTTDTDNEIRVDYATNADTLDGKHASEFAPASAVQQIKSTTFSGTTDAYSNIALWAKSENKIPILFECEDKNAAVFYGKSGNFYAYVTDNLHQNVVETAVSGTVWYVEV